jgi:hypothetical protein
MNARISSLAPILASSGSTIAQAKTMGRTFALFCRLFSRTVHKGTGENSSESANVLQIKRFL